MKRWTLRSRKVLIDGELRPATIEIRHGTIAAIRPYDASASLETDVDVRSEVVFPGLVDTHVHVDEPGRTDWEGFAHATRAAAKGGITTLVDMPLNSIPATVNVPALEAKRAAAKGQCHVDVAFLGGVVPGNRDELAPLHEAGVVGFKCFLVPSGVDEFQHADEKTLDEALAILAPRGALLMAHAESPGVIDAAPRPASTRVYAEYAATRPVSAETEAIDLLLRLAERHDARVHVVHLSSGAALGRIAEARARGVQVTVETCPHYLHFAAEEIADGATEWKCAPPIRGRDERDALWQGLVRGHIQHVASDHSPCPPDLKCRDSGDFMAAWGGISSIQLTLSVLWTGMRQRGIPIDRLGEWLCAAPARLVGLDRRKGKVAPGYDADFVVWEPDWDFTVTPDLLESRHKLTPYLGQTLHGEVTATYVRGQLIYNGDVERVDVIGHGTLLTRGTRA